MSNPTGVTPRPGRVIAAVDAVVVLAFAAIGRRSHDESGGLGGVLATAAPFLVGLATAWIAVGLARRVRGGRELTVGHGVAVALVTTAVGLLLRRTLWDRGTAASFAVVTTAFLTAGMAGWRFLVGRWASGGRAGESKL